MTSKNYRARHGLLWFTVEGSGQFPSHLLKIDRAAPVAEDDEVKMHPEAVRRRVVFLKAPRCSAWRWNQNGWRVGSHVEEVA